MMRGGNKGSCLYMYDVSEFKVFDMFTFIGAFLRYKRKPQSIRKISGAMRIHFCPIDFAVTRNS